MSHRLLPAALPCGASPAGASPGGTRPRSGLFVLPLAVAAAIVLAIAASAGAQTEPKADPPKADAAAAQDAPAPAPPPPSRPWPPYYQDRRFDENWEPLDWSQRTKGARNIFEKVKAIPLNDSGSIWVGFGGQARGRLAYQSTVTFGGNGDFEPTMWTWRLRGYTDLHLGKHFRTYGEYIYSHSSIQALVDTFNAPSSRLGDPASPNLKGDVLNLFAEYQTGIGHNWNANVWVGRHELQMGHERILSPGNWLLNRHTFDGVGGSVGNATHRLEAFAVRPTIPVPDQWNNRDDESLFSGVFYTRTFQRQPKLANGTAAGPPQRVVIQPYLLHIQREGFQFVQGKADEGRYTLGALIYGDVGGTGFDFELESMYQTGRWETKYDRGRIDAYAFASEFGYRFKTLKFMPRPFVSFDYSSGDKDQYDTKLGTFDPLYPLAYAFYGFHAAFERKNFVASGVHLDAVLARNVYFRTNYFPSMRRAQAGDGMYDSFGNISRRPEPQSKGQGYDDLTTASMNVGQQWDFGVAYQASPQLLIYGTYLRFWAGQFWRDTQTAPTRNMNGVMVLTQYNF